MRDDPSHSSRSESQRYATGNGFGRIFFDGLPMMVAIVTVVSQPFVQDTTLAMLGLPVWFPHILAIVVAALLAIYKMMWMVDRAPVTEVAILVPVLTLVIFSAYATGNNVVYYAKEGYTRADAAGQPSGEELAALRGERDVLNQQLQAARELIGTLRRAISPPGPSGAIPPSAPASMQTTLRGWLVADAHAQPPPPRPAAPQGERLKVQQLEEALKKYEQQQRELDQKLEKIREGREKTRAPQEQRPLLKSW